MREARNFVEKLCYGREAAATVPPRVLQHALFPFPEPGQPAVAVAQVGGFNGPPAALVVRRLWVWPLRPCMQELERVVVKLGRERQAPRVVAGPQDEQGFWPRDLVNVGHYDDVALDRRLVPRQPSHGLLKHGVALQILIVPRALGVKRRLKRQLMINHLVVVPTKLVPVVRYDKGLLAALKRLGRLHDEEVVNVVVEGVQSNLKKVEFRVDHHEIVHLALAASPPRGKYRVAVGSAKVARRWGSIVLGVPLIAIRRGLQKVKRW